MQPVSAALGRFVWFELLTTATAAAIDFYKAVVGWEIEEFVMGPDAPPYPMWKVPGGLTIGGCVPLPEQAAAMGAPPHWLGNLCVSDVDAAVGRVQAGGGSVLQPAFDIPEIGRIAIVADPTGAAFALYRPSGDAPGHDGEPVVGEVSWCELMSTDPDGVWPFYASVAGWRVTDTMDMGEMGPYTMFGVGERAVGGLMRSPPDMPMSAWAYYVYVGDLDRAVATAQELGGQLLNGPMPIPGGDRVANLLDPQGAYFALHGK